MPGNAHSYTGIDSSSHEVPHGTAPEVVEAVPRDARRLASCPPCLAEIPHRTPLQMKHPFGGVLGLLLNDRLQLPPQGENSPLGVL